MSTRELFFDAEGDPPDREYSADEWAAIFASIMDEGVLRNRLDELEVTISNPAAMSVRVREGSAFVGGRFFELYNEEETLTVDTADSNHRTDLVVVRVDYGSRTIRLAVKKGDPAAQTDPPPPGLQQDANRREIALAEVSVPNGATSINKVFDRRKWSEPRGVVPPGCIVKWSGSIESIPEGWMLCNGSNGTPDLRGLFIVGAGGSYAPGATGGAESVFLTTLQLPSHSHPGPSHTHPMMHTHSGPSHSHGAGTLSTSTSSAHSHGISTARQSASVVHNHNATSGYPTAESTDVARVGFGSTTTQSSGAHSHSVSGSTAYSGTNNTGGSSAGFTGSSGTGSTGSTGGGSPHENRPPYYALAYIMRQ